MRCQWVGDIGDFGKYGLLRALFGKREEHQISALSFAVVWCTNTEPLSTRYMHPVENLQHCDEWLYQTLHGVGENERCLRAVQVKNILNTNQFYYAPLSGLAGNDRAEIWLPGAVELIRDADVIFVDPDDGIATSNMEERGNNNSQKHIYMDELNCFYHHKKSLIIYQTLRYAPGGFINRVNHLAGELRRRLGAQAEIWALRWRRRQSRVFFVVVHPIHADILNPKVQAFTENHYWFRRQPRFPFEHFGNVPLNQ